MTKVRRVPWYNKDEWLGVHEKLESFDDLKKIEEAVQRMETWIKSGQCPPAVEYTCKFLQSLIRDPHFFPAVSNPESDTNLQMQYATSILRFINILGEVESEKSLSLNARALKIGLPEWVVNTRHEISHGSCLPSLDILRISVESLLKWLKTNYWDMERDAIKDLVLPSSVSLLKEKLTQLFDIYVYVKEGTSYGQRATFVRDMRNDDEKNKVLKIGTLLYQIYRKELRPWETTPMPVLGAQYDSKNLLNLNFTSAISLVLQTIKPYFEHEMDSALQIFVNYLLQDRATEGKYVQRWDPLLLALHARGLFPSLLNRLVDCMCNANSETDVNAAGWIILLLRSLLTRCKVQKKVDLISSNSIPSSKRIKLDLTEREKAFLTKDRIKHQLSIETGTDESNDVMFKLYEVIARRIHTPQCTLQLQDPKFLTEREIYQLAQKVFLAPIKSNKSTQVISDLLLNMSNRLNKTSVGSLLELMKLKSNTRIDSSGTALQVFDSRSLARNLLPDIQAHSFSKIANVFP